MAERSEITIKQVLTALTGNKSYKAAGDLLGVSAGVVFRRIQENVIESGAKLCSCCEERNVMKGNHFLCHRCFTKGSE